MAYRTVLHDVGYNTHSQLMMNDVMSLGAIDILDNFDTSNDITHVDVPWMTSYH